MELGSMIEVLLKEAILNRDEEAIKRLAVLLMERQEEVRSDIKVLTGEIRHIAEMMKMGFDFFEKRFEAIDKRFEDMTKAMDKRFEDITREFGNRFEAIDKRFEDMTKAIDKRFEDMTKAMDKRFEDMNRSFDKKFDMMFKFMSLGFGVITVLITVFKFIK